jgi:hypothetical protein
MGQYLIEEEGYELQVVEENPDENAYTRADDILEVSSTL